MTKFKLTTQINNEDVFANLIEQDISFKQAKQLSPLINGLPEQVPNIDDDRLSAFHFEVDPEQPALKLNDTNFQLNPFKTDIPAVLMEAMLLTAEKKFNAKQQDVYIRIGLDKPTCFIFGNKSATDNDSTAPLQHAPHMTPTKPTPQHASTIPQATNQQQLTSKQLLQTIIRLVNTNQQAMLEIDEYKAKLKKLQKDKEQLQQQQRDYKNYIKKLQKLYRQLLNERKIKKPSKNENVGDWVLKNWKHFEPAIKHFSNSLYMSHNELVNGGPDGKGDKFTAEKYKKEAMDILTTAVEKILKKDKPSSNHQKDKDKDHTKEQDNELEK